MSRDPACAAAIDWAARLRAPAFDDWDAHLAWLEEDPAHPGYYRHAALMLGDGLDALATALPPSTGNDVAANDDARPTAERWWRSGYVAAAALAASIVAVLVPHAAVSPPERTIVTALGETRTVALTDGTRLTLNGGTTVRLPASDPRVARLEGGEVYVEVVHDPARPFRLVAGGATFVDVGTRFDARTGAGETRLAVAEGAVAYDPDRANIRIGVGRSMTIGRDSVILRSTPAGGIGSWRMGRLVYADADLRSVAVDLSRAIGEQVIVSDRVADRRFTGVIVLHATHAAIVAQVAGIAQLSAIRGRDGWLLDGGPGRIAK